MHGSYLVSGGTKEDRRVRVNELLADVSADIKLGEINPDLQTVEMLPDKKSIGIAEVKTEIKFLQEKPFSHKYKILLIDNSDKLTLDAQNALLKTLEEAPDYAIVILSAKTEKDLLETVISRCRKITVTGNQSLEGNDEIFADFNKLIRMSLGERLYLAEILAKEEKDTIINKLENWISEARVEMKKSAVHGVKISGNIRSMAGAKYELENFNVNTRLTIESLIINL